MGDIPQYPKRLIEVDLPIRKISEHARREKSIRQGHLSTLHLWWARRPLAACRAVALGALLPDPADLLCDPGFLQDAGTQLNKFRARFGGKEVVVGDGENTRDALLEFIAGFSNWDLSNDPTCLEVARALVDAASRLRGVERQLVLDPFAGGGAIPVETLRVGADVVASDLNPIPVLLNQAALVYAPRYGTRLADEVRRCASEIHGQAVEELSRFYPRSESREQPIAFLWARTILCEGPDCGASVPLIRSRCVAKRAADSVAYIIKGEKDTREVVVELAVGAAARGVEGVGTVARGSALCPVCGYTTKVDRVRQQLKRRRGGAHDARLLAVVCTRVGQQGRIYRAPTAVDRKAAEAAMVRSSDLPEVGDLTAIPNEPISTNELRRVSVPLYGMATWGDVFTPRQGLLLATLVRLVREIRIEGDDAFRLAVRTCLAFAVDRVADADSSLATWSSSGEFIRFTFARQAVPMVWDFVECNPLADASGSWLGASEWVATVMSTVFSSPPPGAAHVERASAAAHPLPDHSADAVITDPPYYDAVPYAHLSDFFYVWLRRSVGFAHPDLFARDDVEKTDEIVVDRKHKLSTSKKDIAFYERELCKAFGEARRVVKPNGIAVVVFASKSTASWEAVLGALLDAGWIITASWPIASERAARMAAKGQARLESSIHIACRPREVLDGALREERGDWRQVLDELPRRIQAWMPRLAAEGVVGADAIFACLGPALEVFSRYSSVEKASGERVTLREYLEHVWSSVARAALSMVFEGADMAGLEPDARLTAIWLWTIAPPASSPAENDTSDDVVTEIDDDGDGDGDGDDGSDRGTVKASGFTLEFDAARKIAQGLGVRLEEHAHLVETKGNKSRLLTPVERTAHLFGKPEAAPTAKAAAKKKQMSLFVELEQAAEAQGWGGAGAPKAGSTTLDRVHQSMLLFASGRSDALKRFLVEEGVGKQATFWTLAQSLSALYPSGSDEKRWVDGVLARKKGLGFG